MIEIRSGSERIQKIHAAAFDKPAHIGHTPSLNFSAIGLKIFGRNSKSPFFKRTCRPEKIVKMAGPHILVNKTDFKWYQYHRLKSVLFIKNMGAVFATFLGHQGSQFQLRTQLKGCVDIKKIVAM